MTGKSMNLGVVLITAAVRNLTVGKAGFVGGSEVFCSQLDVNRSSIVPSFAVESTLLSCSYYSKGA
jgi:hypothetical protein